MRRIRETRGGKTNDARFGVRGRGEGVHAEAIQGLFEATAKRLGLLPSWIQPVHGDGVEKPVEKPKPPNPTRARIEAPKTKELMPTEIPSALFPMSVLACTSEGAPALQLPCQQPAITPPEKP